MVERAEALLGTPFEIVGRDPTVAIDCCGLMFECYDHAGIDVRFIDVSHPYSRTWWKTGTQQLLLDPLRRVMDVTLTTMLPLSLDVGSWILFSFDGRMVSHLALYVGDGEIIHTFRRGLGVVRQHVAQRYWADKVIGFATTKEELIGE